MANKFLGDAGLAVLVEEIKKKSATGSLLQSYIEVMNDTSMIGTHKYAITTQLISVFHQTLVNGNIIPADSDFDGFWNLVPSIGGNWPEGKTILDVFSDNDIFYAYMIIMTPLVVVSKPDEITAAEVTAKFNS